IIALTLASCHVEREGSPVQHPPWLDPGRWDRSALVVRVTGAGVVEAALDACGEVGEQVVDLVGLARRLAGGAAGLGSRLWARGLRAGRLLRRARRAAAHLERRGRGHLGAADAAGEAAGGGATLSRLARGRRRAGLRRPAERARRRLLARAGLCALAEGPGLPTLAERGGRAGLAGLVVLPGPAELAGPAQVAELAELAERARRRLLARAGLCALAEGPGLPTLAERGGRAGLAGLVVLPGPAEGAGRRCTGPGDLRVRRGVPGRDAADRVEDGFVRLGGQRAHLAGVDHPGGALDEAAGRALRGRG